MSYIRLEKDADGIVELIFDQEGKTVNVMGDEYAEAMPKALDELEAMAGDIKGVYVRSGKPGQFFAGGDITAMMDMDLDPPAEERERMFNELLKAKEPLARLERLGVPVAVGINGPARGHAGPAARRRGHRPHGAYAGYGAGVGPDFPRQAAGRSEGAGKGFAARAGGGRR